MNSDSVNKYLSLVAGAKTLSFDGVRYVVGDNEKSVVENQGVDFEEFGNLLHLKLKSFFLDENVKYLEAIESEISHVDINSSVLFISLHGNVIRFDPNGNTFQEYGNTNEMALSKVRNTIYYFKLFAFFKAKPFSDYFNDADNEIVFYSSVNGIIKVTYESIPVIPSGVNLVENITELISLASPIQVAPFFKNSLYTVSNQSGIIRISDIINKADEVISVTKRDYELVSKQFDFEKFRNALNKEKEKYFTSIREIVGKIFGQAVSIPISISASVFTTYKVSNEDILVLLITLAFMLYIAFYIKLQLSYRQDIIEIENDFSQSFLIITEKSGLDTKVIESEGNKIRRKISSTKQTIAWLIGIVCSLGVLFCIYSAYQIFLANLFY
jgi:hypothetical protein